MNPFHLRRVILARCSAQRRSCKALCWTVERFVDRNQPLKSKKRRLRCGNARRDPNVNLLPGCCSSFVADMGLKLDSMYTAKILQILEALDTVVGDPEGMMAQKMMAVRVVLMIEDTEDLDNELDNGLDTVTGQVAVWVFLMACSEVQRSVVLRQLGGSIGEVGVRALEELPSLAWLPRSEN